MKQLKFCIDRLYNKLQIIKYRQQMGNTCNGSFTPLVTITQLNFPNSPQNKQLLKAPTQTNRFRQYVQKLKINDQNMYRFILPVDQQNNQVKSIEIKILFSRVQMEVCEEYQFKILDRQQFPIIDNLQLSKKQVYHKIVTSSSNQLQKWRTLKYYKFGSFEDYDFKKALYQIHLYRLLQNKLLNPSTNPYSNKYISSSPLQQSFIISHGATKQVVMIFNNYLCSLHQILHYRKLARYQYTQTQILIIINMIIKNYVQLRKRNIIHRDIRPGTIFFRSIENTKKQIVYSGQFYDFANLQTARIHEPNIQDDIITIKGIPNFNGNLIRNQLLNQVHQFQYNPIKADLQSIKHTLIAIAMIQPMPQIQRLWSQIPQCYPLVVKLLQQIERQVSSQVQLQKLLSLINQWLPTSIVSAYTSLYQKQLTISQSISQKLYYSRLQNMAQLQNLYLNTLCDLQKKQQFVPYMLSSLKSNLDQGRRDKNLSLLARVAKYFQDTGNKDNQYYRQAIRLAIDIAKDQRQSGFQNDYHQYVHQAEFFATKLTSQTKANQSLKCLLLRQKAYEWNEIQKQNPGQQNNFQIMKAINDSIILGQKCNLTFQEQLDLIYSKAQLLMFNRLYDQSQGLMQKGYELVNKNYRDFRTKHQFNKFKALFSLGLAILTLLQIKEHIIQKKQKYIYKIQQQISNAQQKFSLISINPIFIIRCYTTKGDLYQLKQDYQSAKKFYETALNLLHGQNDNPQKVRKLSANVQTNIVQRLLHILVSSQKYHNEYQMYRQLNQKLKIQVNQPKKNQKRFSRSSKQKDPKPNHPKQAGLGTILEEDD